MSFLLGWAQSFVSWLTSPPLPSPGSTLADIIMSETRDYGPSPITGGHLSKIDRSTAELIASLILDECSSADEDPAFIAAGICGESAFDPKAIDPNNQDAKPNETPHDKFLHTDFGIGQFDGYILAAEPSLKSLTDEQIQAKAEDITWAIPHFVTLVSQNRKDVMAAIKQDPSILNKVPNKDPEVLIAQAYNSGLRGALESVTFPYGQRWVNRAYQYKQILNKEKDNEQNSTNPSPQKDS